MFHDSHLTADRLKVWRAVAGWSQRELATRAGIHVQSVKYWERQEGVIAGHAVGLIKAAFSEASVARPLENRREPNLSATFDGTHRPVRKGPVCGAKTRSGGLCQGRPLPGKTRCKFHGGRSTGPKTAEGRERLAAAMRARWQERRTMAAMPGAAGQ